jgi:Tfp pilus assembly protein FimT
VRRHGTMLLELVLTLGLLAIVAAVTVPGVVATTDRLGAVGARHDVVLALWAARHAAITRGANASLVVDAPGGRVRVVCAGDTVFARDLTTARRATIAVTRDSITYAPTGLGYGAANTRIIVARGRWADTITTSRLGRVSF